MGVHKAIDTPEYMWDLFVKYKDYVSTNPIKKHVFTGKEGNSDFELRDRPLTYEGFCNYLESVGVIKDPCHYFINYEERYNDFVGVCSRVRREIRAEQIEKGLAGIYNASITQRLNGLSEKTEQKVIKVGKDIEEETYD